MTTERCGLCGDPLPPDTRWRIVRWLNPRPPFHRPDPDCYQKFRRRLGLGPLSPSELDDVMRRARRRR